MEKDMGEPHCSSSSSGGDGSDASEFECNICFELARDPVVTLCGHMFCWPCLYRWLRHHSHSQECPVCKALVQEHKLVPIYGRGKSSTDPRSRSIPSSEIPNRPSGQRPHTAPPPPHSHVPDLGYFPNFGFGMMGGLFPMATARFGNVALSAAFSGLFPSFFNIQVFPEMYRHHPGFYHRTTPTTATPDDDRRNRDGFLTVLLLLIGSFVLLYLIGA